MSRCLLGEEVRYDGGHKRDRFLTDVVGRYVECTTQMGSGMSNCLECQDDSAGSARHGV